MRPTILVFILVCAAGLASFGHQSPEKEPTKLILRPFQQNGRWGYLDNTGKIVIKPQFYWAEEFSEGLAAFENDDGDYGYVNETGKIIIEPIFDNWTSFSEGLAAVSKDYRW